MEYNGFLSKRKGLDDDCGSMVSGPEVIELLKTGDGVSREPLCLMQPVQFTQIRINTNDDVFLPSADGTKIRIIKAGRYFVSWFVNADRVTDKSDISFAVCGRYRDEQDRNMSIVSTDERGQISSSCTVIVDYLKDKNDYYELSIVNATGDDEDDKDTAVLQCKCKAVAGITVVELCSGIQGPAGPRGPTGFTGERGPRGISVNVEALELCRISNDKVVKPSMPIKLNEVRVYPTGKGMDVIRRTSGIEASLVEEGIYTIDWKVLLYGKGVGGLSLSLVVYDASGEEIACDEVSVCENDGFICGGLVLNARKPRLPYEVRLLNTSLKDVEIMPSPAKGATLRIMFYPRV